APIRGQGEMIGALLVNHSAALPFHAEHVAAFRGLATLAGVAAREDSHRAHLEELFMSVIVSLTMALEAKDSATEGHSVRVAGDAIPIEARIMAVADAFDAMTSNRPYRQALPEEEALVELRRNAGTHFDPKVVAAFEQIYPAVKRTLEHMRPRAERVSERG